MKKLFPALAAALLASTMSGAAMAQGASEHAPGMIKNEQGEQSARDRAPGQLQNEGVVDNAREAAPGQIDRGTTASINIDAEQEVEVRRILIDTAQPVEVDFAVQVGATVPNTVTLQPLPADVVTIVPTYEQYQYFVAADGQVVIVEPSSLEVVYVIDAQS